MPEKNSLLALPPEFFDDAAEVSEYTVQSDFAGQRVDLFISSVTDGSRSSSQKMIEDGFVFANNKKISKNYKLKDGDKIKVFISPPKECKVKPENIPLDIIYEDSDIIIVNKPQGMVVHPAPGHDSGTLVSALLYHCGSSLSGINGVLRPGIVHRIDRDTSGLICIAKNDASHISLAEQLKDHTMHRVYKTITIGSLSEDSGTINAPIGRHRSDRKKMAVVSSGKSAVTNYHVICRPPSYTYARVQLETGRTHQIRVYMAYIGHPVLGDHIYGGGSTLLEKHHPSLFAGQCLHAAELELIHPSSGKIMHFSAELPHNFSEILSLIGASE